ncbi:MAG: winged helix-turn-helix domain-containing protein, partial [Planctomycetota bacterium]
MKAVLRRGRMRDEETDGARLVRGPLIVDACRHDVTVEGRPVVLTATEFRLLHTLASRPGRVFRRDELLQRVMGDREGLIDR